MSPKFILLLFLFQVATFSIVCAQNINTIAGGLGDHGADTLAELSEPTGVVADRWGNIYIADGGHGLVRMVDTNGIITTYAGGGSGGDGGPAIFASLNNPVALAVDTFGNLFISEESSNAVRKVNAAGIISTYAGNGEGVIFGEEDEVPATASTVKHPYGIAVDMAGNLYIAESGDSRIRKVSTSDTITTVAGNGTAGSSGDSGPATAAEINGATGVCIDKNGNLYILDNGNRKIRKVSATGIITTYAGNSIVGYSGDGGPAIGAEFNSLSGISVDTSGNVYVSDIVNEDVRVINTSGIITRFAGSLLNTGFSGDGGPDTVALFDQPYGTASDGRGNFYIADYGNNRIRKINTSGIINTFAGSSSTSTSGYKGDGGSAIAALLSSPTGAAYDTAQNLYIADEGNHVVRMINAAGIISTVAGNDTSGYTGDGGPAINARMVNPNAVATDRKGNLFICDQGENVIRVVNSAGIISTYAGNGTAGFSGDGGSATSAQLHTPIAIATDKYGDLYIADESNSRIRKVDTNQVITTIAGTAIASYYGDGGPATLAELNQPAGICLDTAGNIYIADQNNDRIREISTAGIISTIAGNGAGGYSGDGAAAIYAGINLPQGLTVDKYGNLYIEASDYIRKVNSAGVISTITGTGSGGFSGDGGPATAAAINLSANPGMVADTSGDLIIPDPGNNRVREIYNARISIVTASDSICSGSSAATFTATATVAPVYAPLYYQWLKNSLPVGTNSNVFSDTGFSTGDKVMCYVKNGAGGASIATSNTITMVVTMVTPTASFTVSPTGTLCGPTPVVCIASAVHGGGAPVFDWYKNSIHIYTGDTCTITPVSGDNVYCRVTSDASCLVHDTASSAHTVFTVSTPGIPSVTVTYGTGIAVCPGTTVVCSATQTGFSIPVEFRWYKNDTLVYTGKPYDFVPLNGDVIYCKVNGASGSCVTIDSVVSPVTTFTVVPATLDPAVSITLSHGEVLCPGTHVNCLPDAVNGGASPTFNWYKNDTLTYVGSSYTFTPLDSDKIYCKMVSDDHCVIVDTAVSAVDTFKTKPATLIPAVSVGVTPGIVVCASVNVTCTAYPANGGSAPVYEWYKNDTLVSTGHTFTFAPLSGDRVYCELISDDSCLIIDTAVSGVDTFGIHALLPSVSISASPSDSVCAGTSVALGSAAVNGGSSPVYYWYKNDTFQTTTGGTIFSGIAYILTPINGDVVYCKLVSNASCLGNDTAISASDTFVVSANVLTASVSIAVTPGDTVCQSKPVTCVPLPVNGGSNPRYNWYKNTDLAYSGSSYNFTPQDGDVVYCKLISNAYCVVADTVTSPVKPFTTIPNVTPSVSVNVSPGIAVCPGTSVACKAVELNGGADPIYDWYKNGNNVSTGSAYDFVPNNNDRIYCRLTSNASCVTQTSDNSDISVFQVGEAPVITISGNAGPVVFSGTNVTFTASVSGNGGPYDFQWMINGVPVSGGTSYTYTTDNFSIWDSVSCMITNYYGCGTVLTSNSLLIDVYHDIKLYPNPNNGNFILDGNDVLANSDVVNIKIYNDAGRLVYTNESAFDGITFYTAINLDRQLPPGIYMLRLEYNKNKIPIIFVVSY